MKKIIIAICLAILMMLSFSALADTGVKLMGESLAGSTQWRFETYYDENTNTHVNKVIPNADDWNVKYESGILTLKGVELDSNDFYLQVDDPDPALEADGNLVLCMEGDNYLWSHGTIGMKVKGDLKVMGPGELMVAMDGEGDSNKESYAIYVDGDITMNGGGLNGFSSMFPEKPWERSAGIYAKGNITMSNGWLGCEGSAANDASAGIVAEGNITVTGGSLYGAGKARLSKEDENSEEVYIGSENAGSIGVLAKGNILVDGGEMMSHDLSVDMDDQNENRFGIMTENGNITIKSGRVYCSVHYEETGKAIWAKKGKISISEHLEIMAGTGRESNIEAVMNGKVSPDQKTILSQYGEIALFAQISGMALPETGDGANLILWVGMLVIAGLALVYMKKRYA